MDNTNFTPEATPVPPVPPTPEPTPESTPTPPTPEPPTPTPPTPEPPTPEPTTPPQPTPPPAPTSEPKRLSFIHVVVAILIVIVLGITLLIIFYGLGDNNKIVTKANVLDYCNRHNNTISDEPYEYYNAMHLDCSPQGDFSNEEAVFIKYFYSNGSTTTSDYIRIYNNITGISEINIALENEDDYKKNFVAGYMLFGYIIQKDDSVILALGHEPAIRAALIEIGFPNRNWTTEEQVNSMIQNNQEEQPNSENNDEDISPESLEVSQRDTKRRDDIAQVEISLMQYQANHSAQPNNLPDPGTQAAVWTAPTDNTFPPNCSSNIACAFVHDYINSDSSENEDQPNDFEDPNGVPYNVVITSNWSTDINITNAKQGTSKLSQNGDLITIVDDGGDAFDANTIYIIPGGRCVEDAATNSTKRHFAILYMLEDSGVYCLDDQ